MRGKLTLQQRLIIPIVLLGLVAFLSNILAVFSINNVHANAGAIVDEYMVSEGKLEEIRRSMMDIHRLALSHIVAADHATMIRLVQEIKAEEAALDERLEAYAPFVTEGDRSSYETLRGSYGSFKHALVYLVSASADSRTQAAYDMANGDVAAWSAAAEREIDALYASVSGRASAARSHLTIVYITALAVSAAALTAGVLLVLAAFRIIRKHVIAPIHDAMGTLQDSSERISGVTREVRQRPGPVRPHRADLRRPGGDRRQRRRHPGRRRGHPVRRPGYGGRVRRHHRLLHQDAGPGGGDGAVRPGGDQGRSGQDRRDHGHAGSGH